MSTYGHIGSETTDMDIEDEVDTQIRDRMDLPEGYVLTDQEKRMVQIAVATAIYCATWRLKQQIQNL